MTEPFLRQETNSDLLNLSVRKHPFTSNAHEQATAGIWIRDNTNSVPKLWQPARAQEFREDHLDLAATFPELFVSMKR